MKLALAQINTTVGDFAGNARRVEEYCARAAGAGADLVLFPELTIHGYPPRDLLDLEEFVLEGVGVLEELATDLEGGPVAVVGFAEPRVDPGEGNRRYNSLAWLQHGSVQQVARKSLLPNYDVFDERRHFEPAGERTAVDLDGTCLGLSICEDLWNDKQYWRSRRYALDPLQDFAVRPVDWLLNASASPYARGKPALRRDMLATAARQHGFGIALCNLVGGNDSLVFDGNSLIMDGQGHVRAMAGAFEEELLVVDLADADAGAAPTRATLAEEEEVFQALVLGVRDYTRKTGFRKAVIGLSGGIDSSVTAAVAAAALGPEQVLGVTMPSRFTSDMSNDDAALLARSLGIGFEVLPIEPLVLGFEQTLAPVFGDRPRDVTEENLQARVRGMLLMAISNKRGHLVLSTGNKSELAVGYCTLYGDMAGGLAVIGDLEKTQVFRLARWLNRDREVIPWRVIERPPSAELAENQKDEDSLPPYDALDPLLRQIVEQHAGSSELVEAGHLPAHVDQVRRLLIRSEYKRRQAAPTLKVSSRAFGEGWRFPIAHGYAAPPSGDDPDPGPGAG